MAPPRRARFLGLRSALCWHTAAVRHFLYRHFATDGELLYIGISLSAFRRLRQHQQHASWFDRIARVEIQPFPSRGEALVAERAAIASEHPAHNLMHVPGRRRVQRASRPQTDGLRLHGWRIQRKERFAMIYAPNQECTTVCTDHRDPRMLQMAIGHLRRKGAPEAIWKSLSASSCAPSAA